jgi:hypothetical protein
MVFCFGASLSHHGMHAGANEDLLRVTAGGLDLALE